MKYAPLVALIVGEKVFGDSLSTSQLCKFVLPCIVEPIEAKRIQIVDIPYNLPCSSSFWNLPSQHLNPLRDRHLRQLTPLIHCWDLS